MRDIFYIQHSYT